MNSKSSNLACNLHIAALERTVQRLVDSNEQLLEFLKKALTQNNAIQKNMHSDVDTSDGGEIGENEVEGAASTRRKYTPQEIIDMLCEDSEKQRCAHAGCASKANSTASSVASAPDTPSAAEGTYAAEKKRKLNIKEYFSALATTSKTVEVPIASPAKATGPVNATNSTGPCAYVRGGHKTGRYLTTHPYIRHRDDMQVSATRIFVNKPPKSDECWWLAIKIHASSEIDKELKGWYTSMEAAKKARDDFLAKWNYRLIINQLNTWQMVPMNW